jgi:hypothetical protein
MRFLEQLRRNLAKVLNHSLQGLTFRRVGDGI